MSDYIDREAAINLFYQIDPDNDGTDGGTIVCKNGHYNSADIESMLSDLPAADVKPVRHGEWIEIPEFENKRCSECRVVFPASVLGIYCPFCGARMDRGAEP